MLDLYIYKEERVPGLLMAPWRTEMILAFSMEFIDSESIAVSSTVCPELLKSVHKIGHKQGMTALQTYR
jgi:hypothetical protein